jgi:hypothetical protein
MTDPGYREGSDRPLWWKVAKHLDEARLAVVNALAHGLDDPTLALALQDKLRDAQVTLLEIFRAKGLLPSPENGRAGMPVPPLPPMGFPPMIDPGAPPPVTAVEVPEHVAVSAAEEAAAYEDAVEDPQPPSAAVVAAVPPAVAAE